MDFHITIQEAIDALEKVKDPQRFVELMRHGTMSVEYYVPRKLDTQTPHEKDELYVIASGHSSFFRDGETIQVNRGDILFVPAGMEHRFIDFSADFATLVIFYGMKGGEVH